MNGISLLILCIICYFVAKDAKKRDMNYIGWSIFVFLVLIIGLPLYFVFRKPVVKHYQDSENNNYTQKLSKVYNENNNDSSEQSNIDLNK